MFAVVVARLGDLNARRVTARVRSRHASSDFGPREQRYGDEGWGGRDRAGGIEAERKGAPGPACN